jgi:hypothetical protein
VALPTVLFLIFPYFPNLLQWEWVTFIIRTRNTCTYMYKNLTQQRNKQKLVTDILVLFTPYLTYSACGLSGMRAPWFWCLEPAVAVELLASLEGPSNLCEESESCPGTWPHSAALHPAALKLCFPHPATFPLD